MVSSWPATDIQSTHAGKDVGAKRAIELLQTEGEPPRTWHTIGDSPSDIAMADWLYSNGFRVTHVDVNANAIRARKYQIFRPTDVGEDAAVAYLITLGELAHL